MNKFRLFLLASSLFLIACSPGLYQTSGLQYQRYDVKPNGKGDQAMAAMLAPYSKEIGATMNTVIGRMASPLEKNQQNNSLGFFMTDALYSEAAKQFNTPVDVAFMNYGGIRMTAMPAGNITVGGVFEIMPFDNLMILVNMKGDLLQRLFNHIAGRGGWPLTGGSYTIENKKATDVLIGGKPIDPAKTYVVALSDYVANGGDDCDFLKPLPQQNKGYLQRDAIINYVKSITAAGKAVELPVMNRVKIVGQ